MFFSFGQVVLHIKSKQKLIIPRQEGLLAFYKGFNASCLRLVSWNIVLWLSYEQLKIAYRRYQE